MGEQAEPFENGKLRDNVIFNADCVYGMSHMPDKSVDLIVTDPPYLEQIIRDALSEYYRILKDNSAIYMFCSWHHIEFFKEEFEKHFILKKHFDLEQE